MKVSGDDPATSRPMVFISYSHHDEAWKDRLVRHLRVLKLEGNLEVWDDRRISAGDEWRGEIQNAMEHARVAVLLISADFLNSEFIRGTEVPRLLERHAKEGLRIIPLIVHPCPWQQVDWLPAIECRPMDGRVLSKGRRVRVEEDLSALASETLALLRADPLAGHVGGPQRATPSDGSSGDSGLALGPRLFLDTGRLPIPGPHLFGREAELERLDTAWDDPAIHVLTFVAFGGVGKSALVHLWMDRMAADGWRGATHVLDWSFYSQGTEDRVTSAEFFIDHALRFFGDGEPRAISLHDRGTRLAGLIRKARVLLVLDGIEPLQYPPGRREIEGRLKDAGLSALLKGLAAGNPGLCVVTTREPIADLAGFPNTAQQVPLEELKEDAAVVLLRQLGVVGPESELRAAANEFKRHALTLTLLANFLRRAHSGDVRKRSEIDLHRTDERQGGHAFRVIAAYAHWLGDGPELAILRLLGLFDRPANAEALKALRTSPAIPGLTEPLVDLSNEDWRLSASTLRDHNLLAPIDPRERHTLDAHPLVRAYFANQLETDRPEAWQEGNRRLFDYLRQSTPDLPETLQAIEPLYTAIVHGCRAGRQSEALTDVYKRRIQRGDESFGWTKLAAFGSELTAWAAFFERRWSQPSTRLAPQDQAFALKKVAFVLWALGRPGDGVEPLEASLHAYMALGRPKEASDSADYLSKLTLSVGEVQRSVAMGQWSVELADRNGDAFHMMTNRATWANALHQAGRWEESARVFQEAEAMQAKRQPKYPWLYLLQGCRYCDLLLNMAEPKMGSGLDGIAALNPRSKEAARFRQACNAVLERVTQLIEWRLQRDSLLATALEELVLGGTQLALALVSTNAARVSGLAQAAEQLGRAVDGLRRSGQETALPRGLLARGTVRRFRSDLAGADADINEALEISKRGGMLLDECDANLALARLLRENRDLEGMKRHVARARELVNETGYGRREREVAWFEQIH